MSDPIERMERKQAEAALWLDLLEKAERVSRGRQPTEDDLTALRMAVHELKRPR